MNFVEELRWRGMVHTMMPGTEELLWLRLTWVSTPLPTHCISATCVV